MYICFQLCSIPAARDDAGIDAVEADDVLSAEDAIEEEAPDAGDTVLGEDVHAVVDLDPVLDLGREIGNNASGNAQGD